MSVHFTDMSAYSLDTFFEIVIKLIRNGDFFVKTNVFFGVLSSSVLGELFQIIAMIKRLLSTS